MNDNTCKFRLLDGTVCGMPDARYGATIESLVPREHRKDDQEYPPYYTVMVCKRHFDLYLSDTAEFIDQHGMGCEVFLTRMADAESIRD